jgi:probable F420-dependent oxidoreductase
MQIKYRIGVMPGPWPAAADGAEFLWRFVDQCERGGIDSVWFSERLSSPLPVPEPMTTMAAVAARTRRLKFGPSVLIMPFRTPVLAAREMAMIDYLSGGRMLPAVGIGVESEREFQAAGVPFRERGRRTDEAIRIMRLCWEQDEVTYAGEFWKLERVSVLPKPAQKPFPLWIGGNSEAAMRRAGRFGDGWIPSFITPSQLRIGVEKTQAFAQAAGREVPADHFGALFYIGIDRDEHAAWAAAEPYIPKGRVDEATLAACTAFGPAELVAAKIEEYIAAGASKFVLRPMCPPERVLDQLAQLADAVIPAFHGRV